MPARGEGAEGSRDDVAKDRASIDLLNRKIGSWCRLYSIVTSARRPRSTAFDLAGADGAGKMPSQASSYAVLYSDHGLNPHSRSRQDPVRAQEMAWGSQLTRWSGWSSSRPRLVPANGRSGASRASSRVRTRSWRCLTRAQQNVNPYEEKGKNQRGALLISRAKCISRESQQNLNPEHQ